MNIFKTAKTKNLLWVYAIMLLLCTGTGLASPMLGPMAQSISLEYEGGYRLHMSLCGDSLCRVSLKVNGKTFNVADKLLREVVDPALDHVRFYIDNSTGKLTKLVVKLTVRDFENVHPNAQEDVDLVFTPSGFSHITRQTLPMALKDSQKE